LTTILKEISKPKNLSGDEMSDYFEVLSDEMSNNLATKRGWPQSVHNMPSARELKEQGGNNQSRIEKFANEMGYQH